MAEKPETALYFTSVVVVEKDLAVLSGHLYLEGTEPSMTRCLVCANGKWGKLFDFDEVVYAATKKPPDAGGPRATLCMMGRSGHYTELAPGAAPVDSYINVRNAGYLMDLRYIDKYLYACGVQNQVFRQVGTEWVRSDDGTFAPLGDQVDRLFHSIDGFSKDDIYAVGNGGAIWHWNGQNWTKLDSPTNYHLYCVLCASDGNVYVGGGKGQLFAGRVNKGWRNLSNSGITSRRLEDMTEFQGRVYIAANKLLLSTSGGVFENVEVPIDGEKSYYTIDSGPESLWCAGDECVLQFDGRKWRRHICSENG